jgi:hypothetical protein
MKKIFFVLLLTILTINISAEEKFSFQTKPLLGFVPFLLNFVPSVIMGVDNMWEPPIIIIDVGFQYSLNKKITLFINPVFAQGFWKYQSIDVDMNEAMDYYSSNCLDLVTGVLYRPFGTGLRGMYLGAFSVIGWGYVTHAWPTNDSEKMADFFNLGFIAEIGYEWIFNNGFTITLGAGISKMYQIPKVSVVTEIKPPLIGNDIYDYGNLHGLHFWNLPVDPTLRFSIGYSF